jgi:hypothetical protein
MSLNPKIWGPKAWFFFHSVTLAYPDCPTEEEKIKTKTFFLSLDAVLPCAKCRKNFKDHIIKFPLTDDVLNDKKKLVVWLLNIHNEVNIAHNKKIFTYDELLEYYNNAYSGDVKLSYISLVIVLVIILLIVLVYCFKSKIIME